MQYSAYRFIAKCRTLDADLHSIFVWNALFVINLLWVLLFPFSLLWSIELCALHLTTVIMQAPHALIVYKCDDNLFDRKTFWTLHGFQLRGLLDWNRLVSEIKNTNMSSGVMLANQQFSHCLIWLWRPCWSWTMNTRICCMKEILKEICR